MSNETNLIKLSAEHCWFFRPRDQLTNDTVAKVHKVFMVFNLNNKKHRSIITEMLVAVSFGGMFTKNWNSYESLVYLCFVIDMFCIANWSMNLVYRKDKIIHYILSILTMIFGAACFTYVRDRENCSSDSWIFRCLPCINRIIFCNVIVQRLPTKTFTGKYWSQHKSCETGCANDFKPIRWWGQDNVFSLSLWNTSIGFPGRDSFKMILFWTTLIVLQQVCKCYVFISHC